MVVPVTASIVPPEQWRRTVPIVCSVPGRRSAELLRACAEQFGVERAARYQPGQGRTWCNIYLWDVTSALGAEIPHWVDLAGEPTAPGHGAELSANATVDWLERLGPAHGWSECGEAEARAAAREGRPAVAVWRNPAPGHSGHVALVLPDSDAYDAPRIAQAGAHNLFNRPLHEGFGSIQPRYFQHV